MDNSYEFKKARLAEQMRRTGSVRLGKKTSNLFRNRDAAGETGYLDVADFNRVLEVNAAEGWAEVEGMATYEDFVATTLPHGTMPAVVPQLKTITVGGAVSGIGIEATSFRYGLVHETVLEMEILLPTGETVTCSKDERPDLFYGFPNSYGTLGYALKLKVKIIPVKQLVKIEHTRCATFAEYFRAMDTACASGVDFLDGTIFSPTELYVTTGTFVDAAPFTSDYTYKNIYYKSIREKKTDFLPVADFIWRWDTDWFWCSGVIGAQNPIVRRLLGKKHLNSLFYTKLMRWSQKSFITQKLLPLVAGREEWVIQDVDIPIEHATEFAEFFFEKIGVAPVWVCPVMAYDENVRFSLYPLDPRKIYLNFGFWGSVPTDKDPGYHNRLVEAKVTELHGRKGLYSDSYYTEDEFWKIYDRPAYDALKQKYDPQHKLKTLYEKSVKKQ
jgi:FAD/FMN-containing dehydrogenase